MIATTKVVYGSLLSAALVAESAHQVRQIYYESGDCTGTPAETDGISGDQGCFTTSQGFQSENILCDADNAAMHVTLYKDGQCSDSQVLNAFSIASNSCHVEPTLGGSFSWACYNAASSKSATPFIFAKNTVSANAVAYGTHQVKQVYYTSGDCTGTPAETDGISGDQGCFTTSQGFQSENILCDADNAAMHVTLYKDGQCSDSQVLNAFSIASNSCHVEPTLGGSFSWACYNAPATLGGADIIKAPEEPKIAVVEKPKIFALALASAGMVQLNSYKTSDCTGSASSGQQASNQCKDFDWGSNMLQCSEDGNTVKYIQFSCHNCACAPAWTNQGPSGSCHAFWEGGHTIATCLSNIANSSSFSSSLYGVASNLVV